MLWAETNGAIVKGANGSDKRMNEFGYLGYPFFYFLPVSTPRMETDGIRMETDLDILDIHFPIFLPFPSHRMIISGLFLAMG